MLELNTAAWIVVIIVAIMIGIAKTGIPGISILVVPMMASVMEAKTSVGLLLGVLIVGDLFAIIYYRRDAQWGHIIRLLPATIAGILAGYGIIKIVDEKMLTKIIGAIVLSMLIISYLRNRLNDDGEHIPKHWLFGVTMGFFAGVTTMMANAAGPVMIIYLIAMRLPKIQFVGTAAWFFFLINWLKVPFSLNLEMMTMETIKVDLILIPFVFVGAAAGIWILKKIPQKAFAVTVQLLAAAAAVKLLFWN